MPVRLDLNNPKTKSCFVKCMSLFLQARTFPQISSDAVLHRDPERPSQVDGKHEHVEGIRIVWNVSNYRLCLVNIIYEPPYILKYSCIFSRHFSEKYSRAFDSEWYKRAVEHHAIEPESFVFSVPFRDGSEAEDLSGRPPLVLATHAVFVESRAHRAPAAVVGLHFQLDSLARHFLNVTSTVS